MTQSDEATVYRVEIMTGAKVLPLMSIRYNEATGALESYEARPGRTLTQAEWDTYRSLGADRWDVLADQAILDRDAAACFARLTAN